MTALVLELNLASAGQTRAFPLVLAVAGTSPRPLKSAVRPRPFAVFLPARWGDRRMGEEAAGGRMTPEYHIKMFLVPFELSQHLARCCSAVVQASPRRLRGDLGLLIPQGVGVCALGHIAHGIHSALRERGHVLGDF